MIYTITTNPSLDYYLLINELIKGSVNRSGKEEYDAAGKGVNVSKFLNVLGIPSVALGFLGGYNKDHYLELLTQHKNIQPQFTSVKENTRINVKIWDEEETSLNAIGPNITEDEYNKFSRRLNNIFDNDYVVLSGNVQEELVGNIVFDIKKLIDEGVKVVLETDDVITEQLIDEKPFMIKMARDSSITDEEEIINYGKELVKRGVKYFMYSASHHPSILVEDGAYYRCDISSLTPKSITGTSDSMIAGFLWACLKGANSLEAFTYANAVTISTNILDDSADMAVINNHFDTLQVERYEY